MTENEFVEELKKLNIIPTQLQLKQLDTYYHLLIEWNEKINLTAITEKKDVYLKHFYDSLTLIQVVDLNSVHTLCDVGTGAGFPGIVIKIFYPNINIILLDALNKRIIFLNEVIKTLDLKGIECVHGRAEEYGIKHREEYDVVVARAVAQLPILLEYLTPIAKVNGYVIAMKGHVNEELSASNSAIAKLDLCIYKKAEFQLPYENSERNIIAFKKLKETDIRYPRSYDNIKKRPL